jgi:hypothetical protein
MANLKYYNETNSEWETLVIGKQGPSGIANATAPVTYDGGTQTVGLTDSFIGQTVRTYASASARNTAIPSPTEGMMTYLEDSNSLEVYNGSLFTGISGLNLIRTSDFSGAVSHSFGSDADPIFTSRYTNYKIVLSNVFSTSSLIEVNLRLRANTSDLTTNTYQFQVMSAGDATISAVRTGAVSQIRVGTAANAQPSASVIELQQPALTRNTTLLSDCMGIVPGAGPSITQSHGYIFDSVSYNGFTIRGEQNISGTMSVYGYNK